MNGTEHNSVSNSRLDPTAVSLSCAMVGGFFAFWYTFLITMGKNGGTACKQLRIWVPGFINPPIGSVISFLWGFAGGLVGGRMYAHLYNMFTQD
ncbi:MAG: hypothetical protein ACOCW2_00410 [Chitinivibrionales bacterium]